MPGYDDIRFSPPAPVAQVLLRHPDRDDQALEAAMLIDSGADATLIPRATVESLGLSGTGERYRLMAFDGAITEAEAVRADLSFTGRRFRGRFLVVESEIGVLGRDVLNHLLLSLDGPSLRWQVTSA